MDLPTCPACGQSVLDDDVDDCPFCGSSLSGKPSASKAAVSAPAASSSAESGRATTATKRTSVAAEASPSESGPADDDPFALERSAAAKKKVVPLKPAPEPGRRHPVVCPMCETTGYTATKAAGRDVRCANPDCRFPIFTAPPLEDATDDEGETNEAGKRELWTPVNIGAIAGLVLVVGIAVWFFGFRKPAPSTRPDDDVGDLTFIDDEPPQQKSKTGNNVKKSTRVDPLAKLRKLRGDALQQTAFWADALDIPAGTRPLVRELAVDGYARAGDLAKARERFKRLQEASVSAPYYEIGPRVEIAWQLLAQGTPEARQEATSQISSALKAADSLPSGGRRRLDAASRLAAALFAVGREQQARELTGRYNDSGPTGQASLLLTAAREMGGYDVSSALQDRPLQSPRSPQRVAVVLILVSRGRWEQGLKWARMQADADDRNDCLAAWAEARAGSGETAPPEWNSIADELPPAKRAAVYARAAVVEHRQKTPAKDVAAALQTARKLVQGLPVPQVRPVETIEQVFANAKLGTGEQRRRETAAAAAAELARAELRVGERVTAVAKCWDELSHSLDLARTIGPPPPAAEKLNEIPKAEVGRAFELQGDNEIALKYADYKSKVGAIASRARARMQLEAEILERAAGWNAPELLPFIWKEVERRSQADRGGMREPWFRTRVPWVLAGELERAEGGTHKQLAAEVRSAVARKGRDDLQRMRDAVDRALRSKRFDLAGKTLSNRRLYVDVDANRRNLMALSIACRYVEQGDLDSAWKFLFALRDPVVRIEAHDFVGAMAAHRGMPGKMRDVIRDGEFTPADKAAINHGLAVGIEIPASK